jgi:hypothetical protein
MRGEYWAGRCTAINADLTVSSRPRSRRPVWLALDWQGSFDPSVDRHCHHAFSPSQLFRSRPRRPVRPPRREAVG